MQAYNCHGFNDRLAKGRSSGTAIIHESGITFTIDSKKIEMSLAETDIKVGGAGERLVFFRHPSYPDWDIYTSDRSILNNPTLMAQPHILRLRKQLKRKRIRQWLILIGVALTIITLSLLVINQMDRFTANIAKRIPAEWEQKLGISALTQFKVSQTFMNQDETESHLYPLTQPLVSALNSDRYTFQFSIVDNATPNAFALPGGYVVIHSGLIMKANSAEELLGVLAHELIHVSHQHGVRSLIGSASIYLIISAVLGDASGLMATLSSAAPVLISQSYSREYEREADLAGFNLLNKAGINPNGLARFFEMLLKEEAKRSQSIENNDTREVIQATMGFLSTHPATLERIEYLNALPSGSNALYLELENEFLSLKKQVIHHLSTSEDEGYPNENRD